MKVKTANRAVSALKGSNLQVPASENTSRRALSHEVLTFESSPRTRKSSQRSQINLQFGAKPENEVSGRIRKPSNGKRIEKRPSDSNFNGTRHRMGPRRRSSVF